MKGDSGEHRERVLRKEQRQNPQDAGDGSATVWRETSSGEKGSQLQGGQFTESE